MRILSIIAGLFMLTVTPLVAFASSHAATLPKTMLAVNLNSDSKATYQDVLKGVDGVLVYEGKVVQSEALLTALFKQNIAGNKPNADGVIDAASPVYSKLEVLYIDAKKDKGSQRVTMSLEKAGIKQIILDGHYTSLHEKQREKDTNYVAGKVVMADGSEKPITDIDATS